MVYRENAFKGNVITPQVPRTVILELPEDLVRAYCLADRGFRASVEAAKEAGATAGTAEAAYDRAGEACNKPPAAASVADIEQVWRQLGEAHVALMRAKKDVAEWRVVKARAEETWMKAREVLLRELVKAAEAALPPGVGT